MKNKLTFLLATLFLLTLSPQVEAAKDYCHTLVEDGGVKFYFSFEKIEDLKFRATVQVDGNHVLYNAVSSGVTCSGEGTSTLVINYKFDYGHQSPSNSGFEVYLDGEGSSNIKRFYFNGSDNINWNATCGPVLAITSATLASKTSSEIVLNVTSTEATKYKVVCSQFTRELTVSSGTAASGQITLSGLTPSTTYNLTVYAMDGSGNTSSSGISLSVTTNAAPAETTPPTINNLSYALTGNGYSTANITVQATDNIGVTRVEIKNGSTGLLNQNVTSTTSLNQAFAVSGLPIGATTTLTVTVYDAAGNNSSKTINVITNAPNPQMTSASVASTTQNSVTLNVASTGGNGYKVVYGSNTLNTTATDGKITITGLNSGTSYTFTVYAMYDTYQSSNSITVTAKTVEVGCSGESTTCTSGGSEFVSYKINYIGGNILFTVKSTTANQLTSCKLNYATSSSGANAVSNLPMTITNGEATYTLPATGNIASGTLYFSFTYKTGGMGSEGSTTSGWNSAFQYPIGGCALDDGMPYMQSATKASATTSSITLDVSAVVNIDGVASNTAVTQFKVSVDDAPATTYTATNGQITINGLTHSTSYDFEVWAVYGGNTSTNSKTITASTNKESECEGARGHFADASWAEIDYKIEYDDEAKQIKITVTCATQTLTTLQTEWTIPGVVSSAGMENFTDGVYTKEVTDAMLGNPMLIRIQYGYSGKDGLSVTADGLGENSTGIIYYVVGECGTADTEVPIITSATAENVGNTTADIRVVASDDTGITKVVIKNGANTVLEKTIDATRQLDQAFTVTGLTRNTTYSNFSVTVYDRENKNATVTVPPFTTTDTPEPEILSAEVVGGLVSASTAIVAVTSSQANQYKVVDVSGKIADQILKVTSGTAANGRITVTGLKRLTSYTFHVYAMYNNTVSQKYKEISFTTPNGSECSGTRGHYNGEAVSPVNFEIDYIPSNRQLQVRLTCEKALTVRMINWICNGTTYGMSGAGFDGDTYTYTLPEEMVGKEMYIRFEYSYSGINGNRLTALNLAADDPNIIYYKVGECGCKPDDGDNPTMGAVSIASVNTTSVTLNVEGTDPSSTVSSFVVVERGGDVANGATYYATNRKITIAGLASCQTYQWDIYAKDASCNTSENKESITVKTAAENYALNKTASFVYNANTGYTGAQVVDGDLTTRGGTQVAGLTDLPQVLENSVFTVDLGEVKMFNEIDIYWERAASTDYELQASIDNASWSTIARYTSTPKWVIFTEIPKQGEDNMIYRFHNMPARYLRVVPHTLSVADAWGMSIWEFEVYGECNAEIESCPVVLGVRAESIKAQSAVISVSAIDQQTPNHADLTYIVTTKFTNAGGVELTNEYTFAPGAEGRSNESTTAKLTLEGLIPGANYTFTVQAKDPDNNMSCNSNSINIRTGKAEGCGLILEGNDAIETDDWLPFPSGMTYNVKLLNSDANTFDAAISFINPPADITINKVYLSVQKQYTQSDCYGGWIDKEMALQDGKYTLELKKNDTYVRKGQDGCSETLTQDYEKPLFPEWPNLELAFMVETNQGIFHTNIINYNAEMVDHADCEDYFIIFHNGSEPEEDMKTQYEGGTIDKPIYYYRYVTPGQWTPLCLPFAVTAVQVYDPADQAYYNLTAKTKSAEGYFWLRQQLPDVSGEHFQKSWFDDDHELPQKDIAYNFRLPTGAYYKEKYIVFRGAANQTINTTFELGEASTNDDEYRLYGNTTMMPQQMVQAYKEDADGKFYRLHENWTLNPFECYVIAKGSTMARMPIIGRWTAPGTATGFENVTADTILPEIYIYTTLGQPVAVLKQTSLVDATQYLQQTAAAGCYILSAQGATSKVLIP